MELRTAAAEFSNRRFSSSFAPPATAHQALAEFWKEFMGLGARWVLEVDIRKYFDSVDRKRLLELVS